MKDIDAAEASELQMLVYWKATLLSDLELDPECDDLLKELGQTEFKISILKKQLNPNPENED